MGRVAAGEAAAVEAGPEGPFRFSAAWRIWSLVINKRTATMITLILRRVGC